MWRKYATSVLAPSLLPCIDNSTLQIRQRLLDDPPNLFEVNPHVVVD